MSDIGDDTVWSETAASNNSSPPDGWPEGMAPSGVNNSAREGMAALKRFWNQINPVATTAGTSTAYTLTYDVAAGALYDGELVSFIAHATCGAAPTLNKNSLGAKNLRKFTAGAWANLAAADLRINQIVVARYNLAATKWDVILTAFNSADFLQASSTVAMSGAAINEAKAPSLASAATTNIGGIDGNFVHITGTTTITAFDTVQSGAERTVAFEGALTLTHNATSLVLPGNANILTAGGDVAIFRSEGSGNWRCVSYTRDGGGPVALATTDFPAGTTIARAYDAYTGSSALTSNIPADDSIPQVGEGTQILSVSIAPKSITNRVRVRAEVPMGLPSGASGIGCIALFRNGGTNAIDARFPRLVDGFGNYCAVLEFEHVPGSTSAQTYTIRAGGASFDVYVNADLNGRLGGGVSRATLIVEEIVA